LQALAPAAAGKLDEVLLLFGRMCAPLSFVHRAGIVHCDLKPSNVFVRNDDQPVLVDFGLMSRAGGAIGRETLEVGGLRGTLPYLAPELIRGQIPDARADIYAFGCMLYESLTGRPPFTATTSHDLLQAHLYNVPTRSTSCSVACWPRSQTSDSAVPRSWRTFSVRWAPRRLRVPLPHRGLSICFDPGS
jgi:serine/threonine protein kinase